MPSYRERVKPLIITFEGVNQTQVKNYGGLTLFLFLLPVLDRIEGSGISAGSKLAPASPVCGKPQSLCTNLFATTAMRGWLQQQQLPQGRWVSTSLGELVDSPSLDISGSRVGTSLGEVIQPRPVV